MDAAPSPQSVLFARGVIARLESWDTLRIAVQEGWGGPGAAEKRTWLASTIVDAFEGETQMPDDIYIEEMLLQVMSDEYETIVEDGSAQSVAQDIVRVWEETKIGNQSAVLRFEGLAERLKGKKADLHQASANDDNADEWEDESDEDDSGESGADEESQQAPQPRNPHNHPRDEPEIDEDGFTMVRGKRKGRQ